MWSLPVFFFFFFSWRILMSEDSRQKSAPWQKDANNYLLLSRLFFLCFGHQLLRAGLASFVFCDKSLCLLFRTDKLSPASRGPKSSRPDPCKPDCSCSFSLTSYQRLPPHPCACLQLSGRAAETRRDGAGWSLRQRHHLLQWYCWFHVHVCREYTSTGTALPTFCSTVWF